MPPKASDHRIILHMNQSQGDQPTWHHSIALFVHRVALLSSGRISSSSLLSSSPLSSSTMLSPILVLINALMMILVLIMHLWWCWLCFKHNLLMLLLMMMDDNNEHACPDNWFLWRFEGVIVERWSLCLFEGHTSDYFYGMITFSPMMMMVMMIPAILEPTTARVVNSPTLVLQATTKKKVQD